MINNYKTKRLHLHAYKDGLVVVSTSELNQNYNQSQLLIVGSLSNSRTNAQIVSLNFCNACKYN